MLAKDPVAREYDCTGLHCWLSPNILLAFPLHRRSGGRRRREVLIVLQATSFIHSRIYEFLGGILSK